MLLLPDRHAVVLTLRDVDRVAVLIPKHQRVNGHTIAVRHGVEETKILRNLGIDVPSPILTYYDFPTRYPSVMQHQKETAAFTTLHNRCFVFNSMGTAKTLSALWAADYLMKEGLIRKVLILCTMTCMETVWQHEIFTNLFHRTSIIVHGTRATRLFAIQENLDFYILNHDGLRVPGVIDALLKRGDIDLIICDEGAIFRNSRTATYHAMKKLLQPSHRLWMLTGLPCPNGPEDAFGLGKLVSPARLPQYFTRWQADTMVRINQFKWAPKPDSMDKVFEALQPAIRFKKEDCLDLPPVVYMNRQADLSSEQAKAYHAMKEKLYLLQGGAPITAVNAAVKLSKLLQVCCIGQDTPVLTLRGWVPIQNILPQDLLWDGEEWVPHQGVIYNGIKNITQCGGVQLTAEHQMLTAQGWYSAGEINNDKTNRFNWPAVRLPDSSNIFRYDTKQSCIVEMSMRMRQFCNTGKLRFTLQKWTKSKTLWSLSSTYARYDRNKTLSHMDRYATAMLKSKRYRLFILWWARYYNLPKMARLVPKFLARHAKRLFGRINTWSYEYRWQLRTAELPMGNYVTATAQQTRYCNDVSTFGKVSGYSNSIRINRRKEKHVILSDIQKTKKVYDILNCGPRRRFVVRGTGGELRVVHNCGGAITDVQTYAPIDCKPRLAALKEAIEEANAKVVVFVPYTGTLNQVVEYLEKEGFTVGKVDGSVTGRKRTAVLNAFTRMTNPHVLVANPETASHGLNLTVADTAIWFSPIHSTDTYIQACERIVRPGQKNSMRVIHLGGCTLEWKTYGVLEKKGAAQTTLLDLYTEEMRNVGVI